MAFYISSIIFKQNLRHRGQNHCGYLCRHPKIRPLCCALDHAALTRFSTCQAETQFTAAVKLGDKCLIRTAPGWAPNLHLTSSNFHGTRRERLSILHSPAAVFRTTCTNFSMESLKRSWEMEREWGGGHPQGILWGSHLYTPVCTVSLSVHYQTDSADFIRKYYKLVKRYNCFQSQFQVSHNFTEHTYCLLSCRDNFNAECFPLASLALAEVVEIKLQQYKIHICQVWDAVVTLTGKIYNT